jgi:hypothetical protein
MEVLANDYFASMYSKEDMVVPEFIEELKERKVDRETNDNLIRDFSEQEIADALFQIGPLKAPGADGFPARFFQRIGES